MERLMTHAGQVRRIDGEQAIVAVATSGCSGCGHAGGCSVGKLAGGRRETLLALPRVTGLRVGDAVTVAIDEARLARAALLGYLQPAVLLVVGAMAGDRLGSGPAADAFAALGALAGLALGLFLTRRRQPLQPRLFAPPLADRYAKPESTHV